MRRVARSVPVAVPVALALALAASPSAPAVAADTPAVAAGRAKFVLCASCHGGDGRSGVLPEYPKIAGQNEKYLINALRAYQAGRRGGTYAALMTETAKNLTDADILNLAAYLASLDDGQ